jgi:hypothetical protein
MAISFEFVSDGRVALHCPRRAADDGHRKLIASW